MEIFNMAHHRECTESWHFIKAFIPFRLGLREEFFYQFVIDDLYCFDYARFTF